MTTAADIKLLASARMTDTADGGGPMTSTTVVDNVENNIFPDLTTVDRARGAMQARLVYSGLLAAGKGALMGAHLVIDDAADNPAVSAVLLAGALGEQVSDLVVRLNAAPQTAGYKGVTTLTAALGAGETALAVASTRAALIPAARNSTAAAGSLISDSAGTVTGYPLVEADAALSASYAALPSLYCQGTGSAGHYSVRAAVPLPVQVARTTVTSANRAAVFFLAIPPGTEVGSEAVQVTIAGVRYVLRAPRSGAAGMVATGIDNIPGNVGGVPMTSSTGYPAGWAGDFPGALVEGQSMPGWLSGTAASIDRVGGQIALTLGALPDVGSDIVATYALGGSTAVLLAGALGNGGVVAASQLTVTCTAGYKLGAAAFVAGGVAHSVRDGIVRNANGVVVGAFNAGTGVLAVPALNGQALTEWRAEQVLASTSVGSYTGQLPAALAPASLTISGTTAAGAAFSATADAQGVFAAAGVAGSYNDVTGDLALTFSAPVRSGTLAYAATQYSYAASAAVLPGLNGSLFQASGAVPVFAAGDVVVLQHKAETAPAAAVAGGTINCGRTALSAAELVGADGATITSGYTANLATGIVSVTNTAGWAQPVFARHWIAHTAAVAADPTSHGLVINQGPTRAFPAGSTVSSAVLQGTLQAAAGAAWSQQTWTDVWQDSRIGSAIAAQYQDVAHPIEVDNLGAVTERWALIHTSATAFRVVGERLGQIATGDHNSDLAPTNDAVGQPYFTVRALGWGGGWPAGSVLRFNTRGAQAPAWVIRTTQPSEPWATRDLISLAQHGDINA